MQLDIERLRNTVRWVAQIHGADPERLDLAEDLLNAASAMKDNAPAEAPEDLEEVETAWGVLALVAAGMSMEAAPRHLGLDSKQFWKNFKKRLNPYDRVRLYFAGA